MNNPMRKAFGEYLAKQNSMMLNAADAFAAGWDAGIHRMMDLLEVPSNEKAPGEAATSIQRKGDITTHSIADGR